MANHVPFIFAMTDPAPAKVANPHTLIRIAFAKSLRMSFLNDESFD